MHWITNIYHTTPSAIHGLGLRVKFNQVALLCVVCEHNCLCVRFLELFVAFSWACLYSSHSKHCNISRNQPNGIICTHHTNSRLSRSKFGSQNCYRHLFIISHSPFMPSISKGIRDFSCQFEIPQTCLAVRKQALNIDTTHEHSSIKARWSRFTVPHLSSLYFSQLPTISPLP